MQGTVIRASFCFIGCFNLDLIFGYHWNSIWWCHHNPDFPIYIHIITKTKQQPGTSVANQVSFVTDRIIKTSKITFNSFVSVHDILSLLYPACLDWIPLGFAPIWQLNAPCANQFQFQDGGLKLPLAHEVSLRTTLRQLLRSLGTSFVND